MRLLVCGGAGYIGSHMCKLLAEQGHELSVIDNLSTGHREALNWGTFYEGDIGDSSFLETVFAKVRPQGVLHFAAKSIVSESVSNPALYYRGNVAATLTLLDHVRAMPGCVFVFSSTAAIFGVPRADRINEAHPKNPINPYGRSKLHIEEALQDYWHAYGLPSVCFRYFNAAGADWESGIGEAHEPETHLIPRILETAMGRGGDKVFIYGEDYETKDGTCVRDYVHVDDLCKAHLAGLEFLRSHRGAHAFNLGNGDGFTVREVVDVTQQIAGKTLQIEVTDRRTGDPSSLVADASAANECLGWTPVNRDLPKIIESAYHWHRNRRY